MNPYGLESKELLLLCVYSHRCWVFGNFLSGIFPFELLLLLLWWFFSLLFSFYRLSSGSCFSTPFSSNFHPSLSDSSAFFLLLLQCLAPRGIANGRTEKVLKRHETSARQLMEKGQVPTAQIGEQMERNLFTSHSFVSKQLLQTSRKGSEMRKRCERDGW